MPVTRFITEIHRILEEGLCSLCGRNTPRWVYTTRTPVRRRTYPDSVVEAWDEGRWDICSGCAVLVEGRDRHMLMARVSTHRTGIAVSRRHIRAVDSFLRQLQPGRQPVTEPPG